MLFLAALVAFALGAAPSPSPPPFPSAAPTSSLEPAASATAPGVNPQGNPDMFTPPDGWVPMSPIMAGSTVTWRPATQTTYSSISIVRSPLLALLSPSMTGHMVSEFVPQLMQELFGAAAAHLEFTSVPTTMCGSPGVIVRMRAQGQSGHGEVIIEQHNGRTYVITYLSHGALVEEHFLRTLCPSALLVDSLTPPAGWMSEDTLQPIGEWQGPGGAILEMRGSGRMNLETSLSATALKTHVGGGASGITITQRQGTQSCGKPALEEHVLLNRGGLQISDIVLAVRGARYLYTLNYMTTPGGTDSAVLAAMRAFCPQS